MLNLLTASASVLAALLIVQFVLGLVTLWHSTKPVIETPPQVFDNAQKAPLEAPKSEFDKDVWLEPLALSEAPTAAPNEVVYQLCLPAARTATVAPTASDSSAPDLMALTIRELKSLAKERKIKNYSRWTKKELSLALS